MSTHECGAAVRRAADLRALTDAYDELDTLSVCLRAFADLAAPDVNFGPSRNDLATLLGYFAEREKVVLDLLGSAMPQSTCRCDEAAKETGK